MKLRTPLFTVLLALVIGVPASVWASSSYQTTFNKRYGVAGTALGSCNVCHTSVPAVNKYGANIRAQLNKGKTLAAALKAVQRKDSDKDGFTNIVEIKARTLPGDAKSKPAAAAVAALSTSVQAKATAVNTYAQSEYSFLTFDQVDPDNYRYAGVKAEQVVIGQTAGYSDEDGAPEGGMEVAIPLGAWNKVDLEVTDTGRVNIYVDGASEPYASYDF